jgi:hypothetical protein
MNGVRIHISDLGPTQIAGKRTLELNRRHLSRESAGDRGRIQRIDLAAALRPDVSRTPPTKTSKISGTGGLPSARPILSREACPLMALIRGCAPGWAARTVISHCGFNQNSRNSRQQRVR